MVLQRGRLVPPLLVAVLITILISGGSAADTPPDFSNAAASATERAASWTWNLPPGFPEPRVPDDNPMSEAKVRLGRRLFYDPRFSADGSMSCGTCHRPEAAFTDGLPHPVGVTGEAHPRSSMSLVNVAYNVSLTWDSPTVRHLEEQATTPIFGHDPVEMGLESSSSLLERLRRDWLLTLEFQAAFGPSTDADDENPITIERALKALATFQRTLISGGSPFDRYMYGDDPQALEPEARRGMRLFFSHRLGCSDCHAGFNFSAPIRFVGSRDHPPRFHNTGLFNSPLETLVPGAPGLGAYPKKNPGLFRHTGKAEDIGHFKAPTLRNIEVTAPYMHDGSLPTLDAVLDHYAAGGRTSSPLKSKRLTGFELSEGERSDLKAFLRALTDESFLRNPRFGPPQP